MRNGTIYACRIVLAAGLIGSGDSAGKPFSARRPSNLDTNTCSCAGYVLFDFFCTLVYFFHFFLSLGEGLV